MKTVTRTSELVGTDPHTAKPWHQVGARSLDILLVEDDEVDAIQAKKHLVKIFGDRLSLTCVKSCREACLEIERQTYDVGVVDYQLPDGSGVEVIKAARDLGWTGPLFLLTGHIGQEFDLEAMAAGASGCLSKGETGSNELERALRYALDRANLEERLRQRQKALELINEELRQAKDEADRRAAKLEALLERLISAEDSAGGLRTPNEQLEHLVSERTKSLVKEQALNDQQQQFTATVSHEFRTPLALIDVLMQRLERRSERVGLAEMQEIAGKVRARVVGMTELLESARQASLNLHGEIELCPRQVELGLLLSRLCDDHRTLSERPVTLEVGDLPEKIFIDSVLIEQVLENLINNACKYSPPETPVSVRAGQDNGMVRVQVADQGVGIPQAERDRVFDKYFRATTSNGYPGTGLGLWISKRFAALHGGDITVESAEGEGSAFTLTLPCRLDRRADLPAA